MIKSTTLWTLSKFSKWTATTQNSESYGQYLNTLVQHGLASTNPQTQESACQALSITFQGADVDKLSIHTLSLINSFNHVINQYQGVALIGLFDCIATLAEVLGDQLSN